MNMPVLRYDLEKTRRIILGRLRPREAQVYLFGSHATGKASLYSDIDVAILPLQKLPDVLVSEIREELEESDILRTVDVINLENVDDEFRQRVVKEGVLWKD
ncbi:MAG: nucleotidyltransferase domain-containing protein [Chloroflexi bacterium]|nr:nucleotidyltransferase domain-containing protein [Chloroflexota bacterium]